MMVEMVNEIKEVKARKEHKCDWCGKPIERGEVYHYQVIKGDGIYAWKNHLKCMELAKELDMFEDNRDGLGSSEFADCIRDAYRSIWMSVASSAEEEDLLLECIKVVNPDLGRMVDFVYDYHKAWDL